MPIIKRFLNKLVGRGPTRCEPFPAVAVGRCDVRRGVHQPESFDGILAQERDEAAIYAPGTPLLGQSAVFERVGLRPRYIDHGIAPSSEKTLYSLSDAGVFGRDGVVYCPRTRIAIEESMRLWKRAASEHPLFAAPRIRPALPLAGCSLSIAQLSGEGYYHFLLECLPRLWLARPFFDHVDHVLANGTSDSFHGRWLAQAGIPPEKIVWLKGLSHFRCEQLLFTNYLMDDARPTQWGVSAVRRLLGVEPGKPGKIRRLWISRTDAHTRQPAWEQAILAALPGFELILLSNLSPKEQIALMQGAAVVAGPHGAGLANIIFCRPGTKIVELFPDDAQIPVYGRLAQMCQLPYAWASADFRSSDFPAELVQSIDRFIAAGSSGAASSQ